MIFTKYSLLLAMACVPYVVGFAASRADSLDAAAPVPRSKAKPPIPADPMVYERTQPLYCRQESWFDLDWEGAKRHDLDASISNFLKAYDEQCGAKMSARERALWARETAFFKFLAGDNAGCLQSLDTIRDHDYSQAIEDSLALQRARCGGTCTLKANQCKDAKDSRETVKRRLVRKQRATAAARLCRECAANSACKAKTIEDLAYVYPGITGKFVHTAPDASIRTERFKEVGDFNGDGIADLIRGPESRGCVFPWTSPRQSGHATTAYGPSTWAVARAGTSPPTSLVKDATSSPLTA